MWKAKLKLPRRVKLSAFSTKVGHRPMGLQVAQCQLYVQRFPTEFRLIAMQKVVCGHHHGKPFVATLDGEAPGLPTPALSTMNALKWLELNQATALKEGNAQASHKKLFLGAPATPRGHQKDRKSGATRKGGVEPS